MRDRRSPFGTAVGETGGRMDPTPVGNDPATPSVSTEQKPVTSRTERTSPVVSLTVTYSLGLIGPVSSRPWGGAHPLPNSAVMDAGPVLWVLLEC